MDKRILKPCKNCGCKDIVRDYYFSHYTSVHCPNCQTGAEGDTWEQAVENWNNDIVEMFRS